MKFVASLLSLKLAVTALSAAPIQRIHLVHFSHTDLGFTDLHEAAQSRTCLARLSAIRCLT